VFYPKSFSRASKKNTRVGTGRKRRFGAARFGTEPASKAARSEQDNARKE